MKQYLLAFCLPLSLGGCGQFFSTYDISIETRVPKTIGANVSFGKYESMCGVLSGGRCIEVGANAWVTDTAHLSWYSDMDSLEHERDFHIGWLPWRWPNQKYHFLFAIYPGDSATMQIQILKKSDCSHIEGRGKVAYVGSSPCSW